MADEAEPVENQAPEAAPESMQEPASVEETSSEPISEPQPSEPSPDSISETPSPSTERPSSSSKSRNSAGERMRKVMRARKRDRLEKIMDFVEQKRVIRNRDVKLLLQVSDATASRYLKELVNKGQLKQLGRGRGGRYEQIKKRLK